MDAMADEIRLYSVRDREHVSVQWALAASISGVSNGPISIMAQRRQAG